MAAAAMGAREWTPRSLRSWDRHVAHALVSGQSATRHRTRCNLRDHRQCGGDSVTVLRALSLLIPDLRSGLPRNQRHRSKVTCSGETASMVEQIVLTQEHGNWARDRAGSRVHRQGPEFLVASLLVLRVPGVHQPEGVVHPQRAVRALLDAIASGNELGIELKGNLAVVGRP